MKVTLISLYPSIEGFGIRTLSACLKREGHDTQLIFLRRDFWNRYNDETLNKVVELSKGADLVGISLMTNFFDNAIQVTQRIKKTLNIPVLWGGIHPTIRPQECLDYADMVCIGEGEETLVDFLKRPISGQYFRNVEGMWFKDKENIIKNKLRMLNQDLDSIPFPDYDYERHYMLNNGSISKMDRGLLKRYTDGVYMTLPTRGCPFGCTYCCN
ncbi:MAG: cobalamin-dependent protein, partial [Candidatus Omnitrophota bacterium]